MIRPSSDNGEGGIPRPPDTAWSQAWHLTVRLEGSEPEIWRRIAVDEWITLSGLHRVLQVAMGWLDLHLWTFEVRGVFYEENEEGLEGAVGDALIVTLRDLDLEPGEEFSYRYDPGSDWHLSIEAEEIVPVGRGEWLPWIHDGERAGPPEDLGGVDELAVLIEALGDEDHPEHEAFREWTGDDYDPDVLDLHMANNFLGLCTAWGSIGLEPWRF